jgi:hypothetical protein
MEQYGMTTDEPTLDDQTVDAPKQNRNRRLGCFRLILRFGIAIFLLLLIWIVVNYPRTPRQGEPLVQPNKEVTFITAPLDSNGDPDYLEYLNHQRSEDVTAENNAAVKILQAYGPEFEGEPLPEDYFRRLGIEPLPQDGDYFVELEHWVENLKYPEGDSELELTDEFWDDSYRLADKVEFARRHPWSEAQFPLLARWLEENRKSMNLFREAAEQDYFFDPIVRQEPGTPILEAKHFAAQMRRRLVRATEINAMKYLQERKIEQALAEAYAIRRAARCNRRASFLVEALLVYGLETNAVEIECRIAQSGLVTAEQLISYRQQIQQLSRIPPPVDAIEPELCRLLDAMLVTGRKNPWASGWVGDAEAMWIACQHSSGEWETAMRIPHPYFERVEAAFRLETYPQRQSALNSCIDDMQYLSIEAYGPSHTVWALAAGRKAKGSLCGKRWTSLLFPTWPVIDTAHCRTEATHLLGSLIFALEIYKLKQGDYPPTLDSLVPDYYETIPLDPFVERPFIYHPPETADGRYQLYSVDLNLVDNGGKPIWDVGAYNGDYPVRVSFDQWEKD